MQIKQQMIHHKWAVRFEKKSSIKGQAQSNKVEQVQQIINWLIQLHEVRHVEKDNVLSRMLNFIFLFNFGGEANSEMILFLKKMTTKMNAN